MKKMPPAIFTGTVFGLLQSFGLLTTSVTHNVIPNPLINQIKKKQSASWCAWHFGARTSANHGDIGRLTHVKGAPIKQGR